MPQMLQAPLLVLDSGLGGLSILVEVRKQFPTLPLIYFADSYYAPYGNKTDEFIVARVEKIHRYLLTKHYLCESLIACNTATVVAIKHLRQVFPQYQFIGVEPGLKPALALTQNKKIALMATKATLASAYMQKKFLEYQTEHGLNILPIAGLGLVEALELTGLQLSTLTPLLQRYLTAAMDFSADVMVLGCTHYSFLMPHLSELLNNHSQYPNYSIKFIDTAKAVANQAIALLAKKTPQPTLITGNRNNHPPAEVVIYSTGKVTALNQLIEQLSLTELLGSVKGEEITLS